MPNKIYRPMRWLLGPVMVTAFLASIILFLASCGSGGGSSCSGEYWSTWNIKFKSPMDPSAVDAFKNESQTVFNHFIDSCNSADSRRWSCTMVFNWSNTDAITYKLEVCLTNARSAAGDSVVTPKPPCPKPPPSLTEKAIIADVCTTPG